MYKSKLQEICQKRSWSLPTYTVNKEGLDHNPSFSAIVNVNQLSFQSNSLYNSSKFAQNDAARVAFEHFSSPSTSTLVIPSLSSFPQPSLAPQMFPGDEQPQIPRLSQCNHHQFTEEVERLYKNELQTYAQKRNLGFPVYSSWREGPPHACRFKCRVTIDEKTFETSDFFPTLKEAENSAAKIALASLSPHQLDNEDSSFYKNLLQQMFQKSASPLPVYDTTMIGQRGSPLFLSTIHIQGQQFSGDEAKTKKLAEISAAKVAYLSLRDQRKSSQSSLISPNSFEEQEEPELLPYSLPSSISTDIQQHRPNIVPMQKAEDVMGTDSDLASIDISNASMVKKSPANGECVDSANLEKLPNKINLSYKKITVYPSSKQIPNGATLLPFCDENWVAFYSPEEI